MAKLLKLRRGSTSQHSSFTGAEGEVTVDTTKDTLVVHDGSTAGGIPLAKEAGNVATSTEATNVTVSANNSTDETVYPVFVDGATGTQGVESDTGLTYNPSSGKLTATEFVGNIDAVNGDFDGTLEADAITVNGTALNTVIAGVTVANATNAVTATNANHVSVADNESTNENNKIPFIEDASATGNVGLESDGDFNYNPSSGQLTVPAVSTSGNVTVAGNLTVNGTTTTVATTNTTVTDNLLELNSGASSNANDAGILIERGSTGDNAIIAWDESADKFTVGTTTSTNTATGNISITTGTLVANVEGNLTGTASSATNADTVDNLHAASFIRADAADTASSDITFSGGAGAISLSAGSDIRQASGTWTGESPGKIQHHSNILYLQGGTSGLQFRADNGAANGTWNITSSGTLYPSDNAGSDLGGSSNYIENAYIQDIYSTGWVRLSGTDKGLYHSGNNNYFYSDSANYWTLAYNGSSGGIIIRDGHSGTSRGFLYANDSNEVGLLTSAGNWAIKCASTAAAYFYGGAYPYSNGSANLGSNCSKWNELHANTLYGDGSNLTGISSAPEYTMTASGAVTQGKPLVVNSSGQVEQISETVTPLSPLPSEHKNNLDISARGSANEWSGIWEPVTGLFVCSGKVGYGGMDLFNVTVTKITNQDTIQNSTDNETSERPDTTNQWMAVNGSGYGTVRASYNTQMAHDGTGRIVNVFQYKVNGSGDKKMGACCYTITKSDKSGYPVYGTVVDAGGSYSNDNHRPNLVHIGNSVFVATWSNNTYSNGSYGTQSAVLTLSGTNTVTWGSVVDASANVEQSADLTWDSTNNRLVFLYGSDDGSNQYLKCKTGTVSGSGSSATISWGSEVTVSTTYKNEWDRCAVEFDPTTGKTIAAWFRLDYQPRMRVINASSSTPTLGTETNIESSSAYDNGKMGLQWDALSQKMHMVYQDSSNNCKVHIVSTSSSNTNISINTGVTLDSGGHQKYPEDLVPIPDFAMMAVLSNNTSYPRADFYKTATRTSNIDGNPVIGYAGNSASNGGSVTVQLNGAVQENQSGLTPGKRYYPGADGNPSLSSALFYSVGTSAGVALSATKLAINIQY